MTAAFDATRATDQRFNDALSGSDGTADPSIMMPVLDVYPDALSAPMPVDLMPVDLVPLIVPPVGQPGIRAEPVTGPASLPGQPQRGQVRQPATRQRQGRGQVQRQGPGQPRLQPVRPSAPARPVPRPPVQPYRPITSPEQAPSTGNTVRWQGRTMTAADLSAMFRGAMPGNFAQVDRESFQATHPQSAGSGAPAAVAPAAPMASQYSGHGQARNDAREASRERRRTTPTPDRGANSRRKSSVGAVLVFIIFLFVSGIGQKAIDLLTELLNR